ncbi:hypothetical protein BV25DRAFT_167734 [Artomyces pyxidatus]|uniref:Uncharacterized protein n=1 Tax=Artomyces pyxidatus TaxID=48021 RepID=A0ACB8SHW6_9AGAM|nr:hypothetical protein BV25DRAFT_167734 [Artomyces pyxidatus]
MRRLSALVDQVHELARSAPVQHRKPILSRVAELRAAYKKQQERCIDFLQLTQEYADRYLADISDEVRSQGAVLRALEQRLRMAKDLRAEVINLQNAFEKWTCGQLKSVRKSVLSIAIPDDVKLVEEMDKILKTIKMCYKELDKFWIGEVRRVTKAVKTCRMNKEDLDQWNSFQKALSEASGIDEVGSTLV